MDLYERRMLNVVEAVEAWIVAVQEHGRGEVATMARDAFSAELDAAVTADRGAVDRVIANDEAMRRARRAYLNSPPHGTKHDDAARLEHMRAAFRAAFGEQPA